MRGGHPSGRAGGAPRPEAPAQRHASARGRVAPCPSSCPSSCCLWWWTPRPGCRTSPGFAGAGSSRARAGGTRAPLTTVPSFSSLSAVSHRVITPSPESRDCRCTSRRAGGPRSRELLRRPCQSVVAGDCRGTSGGRAGAPEVVITCNAASVRSSGAPPDLLPLQRARASTRRLARHVFHPGHVPGRRDCGQEAGGQGRKGQGREGQGQQNSVRGAACGKDCRGLHGPLLRRRTLRVGKSSRARGPVPHSALLHALPAQWRQAPGPDRQARLAEWRAALLVPRGSARAPPSGRARCYAPPLPAPRA